jgi:hypothetical protein
MWFINSINLRYDSVDEKAETSLEQDSIDRVAAITAYIFDPNAIIPQEIPHRRFDDGRQVQWVRHHTARRSGFKSQLRMTEPLHVFRYIQEAHVYRRELCIHLCIYVCRIQITDA